MVEGWSPCPQVDVHGPKNINGYVNKWGRQTFTAMLMLLFIILLIKGDTQSDTLLGKCTSMQEEVRMKTQPDAGALPEISDSKASTA